jgi:hypothetical protein
LKIGETDIEHRLIDRDWRYWLAEALTLVLTIRDDLPLDGLQAVVAELEQRRTDVRRRCAWPSIRSKMHPRAQSNAPL